MEGRHIGDTFFVRAMCGNDYAFFWDLWVNVRQLKVYRGGVYRAHVDLGCQQDCIHLLPTPEELNKLQDKIVDIIQSGCTEDCVLNELALHCLLFYNEFYYRWFEVAIRH